MLWNTDRKAIPQCWKPWFAWFPVPVGELFSNDMAWLEPLERKLCYPYSGTALGSFYVYRVKETKTGEPK